LGQTFSEYILRVKILSMKENSLQVTYKLSDKPEN